jgi:signal peptidase II
MSAAVRFWLLIVLVSAALVAALRFVWVSPEMNHPASVLGVSLMVGGGLSNLLDRLMYDGAVVDFMHMGVGRLRTGVFNVADVAIMAGPAVLLVWYLLSKRRAAQEEAPD